MTFGVVDVKIFLSVCVPFHFNRVERLSQRGREKRRRGSASGEGNTDVSRDPAVLLPEIREELGEGICDGVGGRFV